MKIKEIITDSITFPFSNPVRFLTLGVILIFSSLILPMILAGGYLLRIIKNTSQGIHEMPPFEDLVNMFIDGLKFLLVNLVYSIPAGIFITLAIMISMFTSLKNIATAGHVSNQTLAMYSSSYSMNYWSMFDGTVPLILLGIGIVLLALSYLVQMIALPRMVYKNNFEAAFQIKEIYKEIKMLGWGKYLICGIFFVCVVFLTTLIGLILPDLLKSFGVGGYLLSLVIIGLVISSFEYAFQGRFMGLIYPGEVENEDYDPSVRKPRFSQEE
jgi:hypothetical protein